MLLSGFKVRARLTRETENHAEEPCKTILIRIYVHAIHSDASGDARTYPSDGAEQTIEYKNTATRASASITNTFLLRKFACSHFHNRSEQAAWGDASGAADLTVFLICWVAPYVKSAYYI